MLGLRNWISTASGMYRQFGDSADGLRVKSKRTVRVANHLHDLGLPSGSDFSIDALTEVDGSPHELPSPPLIPDAMTPEPFASKRTIRLSAISDEAPGRVRVHGQQERDEEVMRVPKRLIALLSDLGVRRRVHEQHAEQHDVSGDAAGLGIVDLHGGLAADLRALDVEEVDVVRGHVHDGPGQEGVRDLAVEPLALVQRQPSDPGSDEFEEIPAHGQEDDHDVEGEAQASASGEPDGEFEGVEGGELVVGGLDVPSDDEEKDVEAVEDGVEGDFAPGELSGEPGLGFRGGHAVDCFASWGWVADRLPSRDQALTRCYRDIVYTRSLIRS